MLRSGELLNSVFKVCVENWSTNSPMFGSCLERQLEMVVELCTCAVVHTSRSTNFLVFVDTIRKSCVIVYLCIVDTTQNELAATTF